MLQNASSVNKQSCRRMRVFKVNLKSGIDGVASYLATNCVYAVMLSVINVEQCFFLLRRLNSFKSKCAILSCPCSLDVVFLFFLNLSSHIMSRLIWLPPMG